MEDTEPTQGEPPARMCATHPEFPAIAVCSLCGRDMCAHCHTTSLTGYAVCRGCPVREQLIPRAPIEVADAASALPAFVRTAVGILRSPRTFFSTIPLTREWIRPALFGYVCLLVGTFFGTLWQHLFVGEFSEVIEKSAADLGLSAANTIAMVFVSLPIVATILFAIHSVLLFASLQIAGATHVRFTAVLRLAGFAAAAHLFQLIPPLMGFPIGHFLAIVWLFHIEVTAVQLYFRLTWGRSLFVVLIPYLFTALFSG